MNTCLFAEPYVVGELKTHTGDYNVSTLMFIGISCLGLAFALLACLLDCRGSQVLCKTTKQIEQSGGYHPQLTHEEQEEKDEPLISLVDDDDDDGAAAATREESLLLVAK